MRMLYKTRCVMLLLIATGMLLPASWSTGVYHTFRLLFKGGQMINATYTYVGPNFRIQCAGICGRQVGCWAFTWDSVSQECHLLNYLTSPVILQSASVSLDTYYVASVNNIIMTMTSYVPTWNDGQTACEALEGRMAVPADVTYGFLLQYVFNTVAYHVGMWRHEDNTSTWYDVDNKVVTNWMVISTSSYQSIVMSNSSYQSMNMSNSSYQPMNMSTSSYQPMDMSNSSYQPMNMSTSSYQPMEMSNSSYQSMDMSTSSYQPMDMTTSSYDSTDMSTTSYQSIDMSTSSYQTMDMWDSWFQPNGTCCRYVNGYMVQVNCSYPVWLPMLCEV